jgi:FkbM family methyltransferase
MRRLRVPGARAFADGDCTACAHRYLIDMHGWLDLTTGESTDPWLPGAWAQPDDTEIELRVVRRGAAAEATLATCLDPDLDRARAKLASAGDAAANVVLVPAELESEVPAGGCELWIADAPAERYARWLRDLEERVQRELRARGSVELARLPVAAPTAPPEPQDAPPPAPRPSLVARGLSALRAVLSRHDAEAARPAAYTGPLPTIMRDRLGLRFEIEDREHATAFVSGGHFEADEIELASRCLTAGMTAFDVGANRGTFTAAMARSTAPGGVVHAFEPGPEARAQLSRTLELNEIDNVEVVPAAVADRRGEGELADYGPGFGSWSSLVRHEIGGGDEPMRPAAVHAVSTVTLDDYCAERGIERIDLLKVDVEGAEPLVLAGAGRLLRDGAVDTILIELADATLAAAGAASHGVIDVLERAGLRTYVLEEGALVPFRVSGPMTGLAQVIAASPRGRTRLRDVGYSVR